MTTWIEIYARCVSFYGEEIESQDIVQLAEEQMWVVKLLQSYSAIPQYTRRYLAYPKLISGGVLKNLKLYQTLMDDFCLESQNITNNLPSLPSNFTFYISTDANLLQQRKLMVKKNATMLHYWSLKDLLFIICKNIEYFQCLDSLIQIYPEYKKYIDLLQEMAYSDYTIQYIEHFCYFIFLKNIETKYIKDKYFDPCVIGIIGEYLS